MSKKIHKDGRTVEEWEHIPAILSQFQRDNAHFAIKCLCEWQTLYAMRSYIQEMLAAAMGSAAWKDDGPEEKAERMFLYDMLIQMIECVYLLNIMVEKEGLKFKIART